MSALVLIGWLVIVAVAVWLTVCTIYTSLLAKAGWGSWRWPLMFLIVATGVWFAACKLAPFTVVWSVHP